MRGFFIATLVLIGTVSAHAASSSNGGVGLNIGLGVPFLTQAGLNYQISDRWGVEAGYNLFSLDVSSASVELSMPEVLLKFHPFAGSYFIGAGVGQETMEVKSADTSGANEVSIKVEAATTIVKTGWMWGVSNGGFWFGMDVAYIMPSSPKQTITAPGVPTTSESYLDAVDAADKFGKTAYTNITFARFGWLF